jgi:hypothetical protein
LALKLYYCQYFFPLAGKMLSIINCSGLPREAHKDPFDTHPILDQEIKRGLEQDLRLRIVLYTAYGLALRKGSQNPATSPN